MGSTQATQVKSTSTSNNRLVIDTSAPCMYCPPAAPSPSRKTPSPKIIPPAAPSPSRKTPHPNHYVRSNSVSDLISAEKAQKETLTFVVLGCEKSGKSSLMWRMVSDSEKTFRSHFLALSSSEQSSSKASCGQLWADVHSRKCLTVVSGEDVPCNVQVWDTSSSASCEAINCTFSRKAQVILVAFDSTSSQSLERAKQLVEKMLTTSSCSSSTIEGLKNDNLIALVGTQSDRVFGERSILQQTAERYAKRRGILYYETSAKTNSNVNEMFSDLCFRCRASETLL